MSTKQLKQILSDCCNDVTFSLDGVDCGIFPSVTDSKAVYDVWYGNDNKRFDDLNILMDSDFFGGISLNSLGYVSDVQAY